MRKISLKLALLGFLMFGNSPVTDARDQVREIGPEADLCGEINALPPGDELVLRPGDYAGPCTVRQGGLPGDPSVIRAKHPDERPRIVYAGNASNVFTIRAEHLVFRGLDIGPSQTDVDGFRIHSRGDVTVEDCRFQGLGGIAVVANHTSVHGVSVRRNEILGSLATGLYFGCHDGHSCAVTGLIIEGNVIRHVSAPDPAIGYGIQVKLNSAAVIRANTIIDTKGPGIMVYGAQTPGRTSLVERNVIMGSRQSAGIVIGGGPALVRNNVTVGNARGGIALEDYGQRGLVRSVVVAHNTVYGNPGGGIVAADRGVREALVVNNAVYAAAGTPALPGPMAALRLAGNVTCLATFCFTAPERHDYGPAPGGPLDRAGITGVESWAPADDFFGAARGTPPAVGAIERSGGPLPLPGLP